MTEPRRIALLADVHANREALAACLDHASRLAVDRYVFLGDLVGYGADPAWVLNLVMELAEQGASVVLGNHDAAVVGDNRSRIMHVDARRVVDWTRSQLDQTHMQFLAGLPLSTTNSELLFVHANAWALGQWEYITSPFAAARSLAATRCRITFCGHVHKSIMYHLGPNGRVTEFSPAPEVALPLSGTGGWLINPGSVGQPRDGNPAASYAIHDTVKSSLIYFRVPYDTTAAAQKIRQAGLPGWLASRLLEGI